MQSVSARTRRTVLSRETIGRVIGGLPIRLHRAGLGRLAGRRYAMICSVRRRSRRVQPAAVMVLREDPATGLRGRYTLVLLGARARPPALEVPARERAGVSGRPSLPTAGAHHG